MTTTIEIDQFCNEIPLYTIAEVAQILDQDYQKIHRWTKPFYSKNRPSHPFPQIVTTLKALKRGRPTVPFVGLVEARVVVLLREGGVPMQHIRPALVKLEQEIGLEHALASKKLLTDGAEILYTLGTHDEKIVVYRNNQLMLHQMVEDLLKIIEYSENGYAKRVKLIKYKTAEVVVDPMMSFGQPIFVASGVRVQDIVDRLNTGEPIHEVADDFCTPLPHVEEAWNLAKAA